MGKFIDLTQRKYRNKFGKWRVLYRDDTRPEPMAFWVCRCKCGNKQTVNGKNLRRGTSTQCRRCADKTIERTKPKHSPGQRVGKWTILKYDETKKRYRCRCECGTIGLRQATNLATGYQRNGENTGCKKCNGSPAAKRMRKAQAKKRAERKQ